MPARIHRYATDLEWTGNTGTGTSSYRSYDRAHVVTGSGDKPAIAGSSDASFRGDRSRWNPEELLVASLSACHMLQFLHRAAMAGVVVVAYSDHASGIMEETPDGGGRLSEVVLRPDVAVLSADMAAHCDDVHDQAHRLCFIANSVNFPVRHVPSVTVVDSAAG